MNASDQPEPRRFLFALWEGGGNVPPQLALAGRLARRGHDVRIMSDACNLAEARASGCRFVAYTRAPSRPDKAASSTLLKDYQAGNPLTAFLIFRDQVMVGPALAYAEDVLEELRRDPADALVVNDGLLGPMLAAERAGLPYAVVLPHHYLYPAPGLPPPGALTPPPRGAFGRARDLLINAVILRAFAGGLPALNVARARLGLAPVADILEPMHRADRVLVLTSPAFDFAAERLPANVRYAGPMIDDPLWATEAAPPLPPGDAPLVVVSFSTTFQEQRPVVQRVIDALGQLPVRGLVTTGPALGGAPLQAPPNVAVLPTASHSAIFPRAAAVVTHAGHGTVIRALAHGLPLLCMPMGRDQHGNAARVIARGAGRVLPPGASAAAIRRALADLLGAPGYRERARALAEAILQDVRSASAVAELEGLPRASAPALAGAHPG